MRFGWAAAAAAMAVSASPAGAVFLYIDGDVTGTRQDFIACPPNAPVTTCTASYPDTRITPYSRNISLSGDFIFTDGVATFSFGSPRSENTSGTITLVNGKYVGTNLGYRFDNTTRPVPRPGDYFISASAPTFYVGVNPPVPEPATWLMMIVGFGGIGLVMRRRRQARTRLVNDVA